MKPYLFLIACLTTASLQLNVFAQTESTEAQPKPTPGDKPVLYEPYLPKPTGTPPKGWEITLLENSKVESTTNIGENHKPVKLSAPAYQLIPSPKIKGEEEEAIIFLDPNYNPMLKNAQEKTIGASLTAYSESATALQEKLEGVILTLKEALKGKPKEETEEKEEE